MPDLDTYIDQSNETDQRDAFDCELVHAPLVARAVPPAPRRPAWICRRWKLPATLMRREGTLAVIQLQDAGAAAGAIANRIAVWRKTAAVRIRSEASIDEMPGTVLSAR